MSSRHWAFVAGAAGDIGQAVVAQAHRRHYAVLGLDVEPPTPTADDWIQVDLGSSTSDTISEIRARIGDRALHHVVSLVGGPEIEDLASTVSSLGIETIRRSIEVNLVSAFVVISASVPALARGDGDRSVTLVSSINSLGGYGASAYSAAKAGLAGLVASEGERLGPLGVRVNAVSLGTTRTRHLDEVSARAGRPVDYERLARVIPMGGALSPVQAARTIWALTADCAGVTGEVLVCDGGQRLRRP